MMLHLGTRSDSHELRALELTELKHLLHEYIGLATCRA